MKIEEKRNFFYLLSEVVKSYRRYIADCLDGFNLSRSEIDVLVFLIKNGSSLNTASDISKYRGISKGLVSKSVNSLIDKGYLIAKVNPEDKRYTLLYISEQSDEIVSVLKDKNYKFKRRILRGIREDELELFNDINNRMLENLKDNID